MGTQQGYYKDKADTPTIANRLPQGVFDGRVKVAYDYFTFAGEAAGEIIEMCPELPVGAKIVDVILDSAALGGTAKLKVGDAESSDRYIAATDHSAATVTRLNQNAGRMYEIVEATRQILVETDTDVATGLVKIIILYTHD